MLAWNISPAIQNDIPYWLFPIGHSLFPIGGRGVFKAEQRQNCIRRELADFRQVVPSRAADDRTVKELEPLLKRAAKEEGEL